MPRINREELLKELKSEQNPYKYDDVGTYGKGKYDGLDRAIELVESSEEKESEETEVKKDIEWLKSAIQQNLDFYNDNDEEWQMAKVRAYAKSLDLINQLDKPEVTLDKAFEKVAESYSMTKEEIWRHLERLEAHTEVLSRELPVIPKFVADWIEKYRERETNVWHLMNNVSIQKDCSLELWSWLWGENNADVLARAWLDGYTVEEEREQKYVVKISEHDYMVMDDEGFMYPTDINVHKYKSEFTEQEIKDYDKRYWAFRKPVEELEK